MNSDLFKGSCHCGRVGFQVETTNISKGLYRCNCSLCKKKAIVMKPLEKDLFKMLINVSGIGPKTAIGLLSAVKPNDFKQRLIAGEVKMLTSLPGIGTKTAKRIIIELKDKFTNCSDNDLPLEDDNQVNSDAYFALINLGFKSVKVKAIIRDITDKNNELSTEDLIKQSLLKLR